MEADRSGGDWERRYEASSEPENCKKKINLPGLTARGLGIDLTTAIKYLHEKADDSLI